MTPPSLPGTLKTAIFGVVCASAAMFAAPAAAVEFSLPMPAPLPPVWLLTILVGVHLIGLCLGLGGATMLDFWILRWMRWGGLPPEICRIFLFVSKVVTVGLALLWLSGVGFLVVYAVDAPEKLANPKLLVKIVIVSALTVNGLLIHAMVLPGVLRDVSRPMFEGASNLRVGVFLVSGAVSGVSWYAAFALGLLKEFNGHAIGGLLLSLWLCAMVVGAVAAYGVWRYLPPAAGRRRRARPAPVFVKPAKDVAAAAPHPIRALPIQFTAVPGRGATRLTPWPRALSDA